MTSGFRHSHFIVLSFLLGGLLWVLEAIIHSLFFNMHSMYDEILPLDDPMELWMRTLIWIIVVCFGFYVQRLMNLIAENNEKLRKALDEIKVLKGIVPICACCKKMRDDEGFWHQVEVYINDHTDARLTHGLCPDCAQIELAKITALKKNHET